MKANNVTKVLELGAGHSRDTIFFASNGIVVDALDYSTVAVNILDRITKKKGANKNSNLWCKESASVSRWLIFSEIRRVLKPKIGLNFFSVTNHNYKSYGKCKEVEKGIYDIGGFEIRFFTEKQIQDLTSAEAFEILWIEEEYEDPVTIYLVSSSRKWRDDLLVEAHLLLKFTSCWL